MLKARLEAASRAEPSWGSRRPCEAVNDGLDGPRLGLHFFKALGRRLVRRLGWLVELYSYFFFFTLFTTCTWISTENIKKSMACNFSQGYRSCDHCDLRGLPPHNMVTMHDTMAAHDATTHINKCSGVQDGKMRWQRAKRAQMSPNNSFGP